MLLTQEIALLTFSSSPTSALHQVPEEQKLNQTILLETGDKIQIKEQLRANLRWNNIKGEKKDDFVQRKYFSFKKDIFLPSKGIPWRKNSANWKYFLLL